MPELPEVETVCRYLKTHLEDECIAQVQTSNKQLREPYPLDFELRLSNQKITQVTRRAKYCQLRLASKETLLVHLGMSGKLLLTESYSPQKHDHVIITLQSGRTLVFNDPRRFGLVILYQDDCLPKQLLNCGPEPLLPDFDADYLMKKLKSTQQPIKQALMRNDIVVGIGNIYAAESLFDANVSPMLPANRLNMTQAACLVKAVKKTLQRAIQAGGSSLKDYRQSTGDLGYFQHQFKVYGKAGDACDVCHTLILKTIQAGRSTFYCPSCQQ